MSSSLLSKKSIAKASIAGATAIAIDKFYFKSSSLRNSMILGGCVGASSFIVSTLKKNMIPDLARWTHQCIKSKISRVWC